jgi:hypothetical protein
LREKPADGSGMTNLFGHRPGDPAGKRLSSILTGRLGVARGRT